MQQRKKPTQIQKGNHLKQDISLLCLIANENTGAARKLMKECNIPDSSNHEDLELNLSKAYKSESDKKAFEKKLAEIHPHKDFILKYLGDNIGSAPITPAPTAEAAQSALKQEILGGTNAKMTEDFHNCSGSSTCQCNAPRVSNACGCSGFHGFNGAQQQNPMNSDTVSVAKSDLMTIGIISIVAIFGLALYAKGVMK